jgi:hypothetical protein
LAFGDNRRPLRWHSVRTGQPGREAADVSVAVGFALNPAVKVLLIREGAFLDEDNLALVGRLAEEAGAQIWIERVGTQGVSVS